MQLPRDAGLRIYAEILRRKGKSVLDAQTMTGAEPWYVTLTWNGQEEAAFQRWFKSWCVRTLGVSARAFEHDRWIWALTYGLHRRDICDDPQHPHDEATERDLSRAKWLSVKDAMVALPKDQWPK
jgi:hypothetical protein